MARLIIQGGRPVGGRFRPAGNKNAALPMIAASVLTDAPMVLRNVPDIADVQVMMKLVQDLGVSVERQGCTVRLCAGKLRSTQPNPVHCRRIRASILLAGPLAARHGQATLTVPGGDGIGRRRLDPHLTGLQALGIQVETGPQLRFRRSRLAGCHLLLEEASVTATENLVMAAALCPGETVLYNAACEPHVQDLCDLLGCMGASIEGQGTNRIVISGVDRLHGAEFTVAPDHIETGSFLTAAAVTGGELLVEGMAQSMTSRILGRGLRKLGVDWGFTPDGLLLKAGQALQVQQDVGFAIPTLEDGVWPAFPSDLMSVAIVAATQARGSILFFEKLFESRMYFVDRLIEMGAHIVQCDPHRVIVQGPSRLLPSHMSSPDIRAGMAMVIAALCAEGPSVIENADMIDRGYEAIDARLRDLGALIEREG